MNEDIIKPSPGLYLVATPIGNLKDITLRALEVLRGADLILCEDTRVTAKLLQAYGIKTTYRPYHDHSETRDAQGITAQLKRGQAIALVSDAGMPLISDPGYKLVQACMQEQIPITSLPGANAPLTALQLSGLPSHQFTFLGFLPPKEQSRRTALQIWKNSPATLIFYESKQRVLKTLAECLYVFGNRQACVARELTKKFEEVITAPLADLISMLAGRDELKGEFVLLVAPPDQQEMTEADLESLISEALREGEAVGRLSARLAEETGRPKKTIYELALKLKNA